jgi:hypothetical protein
MAETTKLILRGPAIPPLSMVYQKIENIVGNPTTPFLKQAAGATAVFIIPLTGGALGGMQHLVSLQGTETVCFTSMGREDSIDWLSSTRSTKVLEVTQIGASTRLKLQLV